MQMKPVLVDADSDVMHCDENRRHVWIGDKL